MVTSVQPVGPMMGVTDTGSQARQTERSIAEARRLLSENKITGASAMRIQTLLDQAEQRIGAGNPVNAQRIARTALKQVRELSDTETTASTATPTRPEEEKDETTQGATETTDQSAADGGQGKIIGDPNQQNKITYQDGSSDSGVSFQYAQPIASIQSPFAVRQHEMSHIRRDTADAILNGQKVLTSVRMFRGVNPGTGEPYVAGGQARIIVFPENKISFPSGNNLDTKA